METFANVYFAKKTLIRTIRLNNLQYSILNLTVCVTDDDIAYNKRKQN